MNIALITGITGQDGSYLSEFLLNRSYIVYGIVRRTSELYCSKNIKHIEDKLNLIYGDVTDSNSIVNIISEILQNNKDFKVLEIYNLAAQSHVAISFDMPAFTTQTDAMAPVYILEYIKKLPLDIKNKIKFYQAGTSELYGKVLEIPQKETTPFNPVSPYAAAKHYAYTIVKIYRDAYNLFCVNGILFNHESPRRGKNFVTMKIINGIKDIIDNKRDCIKLGNLDSKRDWGHAKDYVYGMWLMLQEDKPEDYVLATGTTYTIREFIEKAFSYKNINIRWEGKGEKEVGLDDNDVIRIKVDKKYYRPNEVDLLIGDPTKAITKLKWHLEYKTIEELIEDMFT